MITRILFVAALSWSLLAGSATAEPNRDVVGLWSYRTVFYSGRGEQIDITKRSAHWHAALGRSEAEMAANGNKVDFVFPNDAGTFRGVVDERGLHGFWIRPAVVEDPLYPFGEALPYTGPISLKSVGVGHWRARVLPLEDTFTLYLKIFRDADGSLKAAFRNPEQNSHGGVMQFTATQAGDSIRFDAQPDPAKPAVHIDAVLSRSADRLSLYWEDLKRTVVLSRTAAKDAVRFYPRSANVSAYSYRVPKTGDGWQVARARDLGVDEAKLSQAVQRIIDVDPASARPWMIHSMAVAYKGKLILDEYFYGFGIDEPHDMRSASKTFSSVMLGALMMEGVKISPETKIYDALAGRGPFANPDPRKSRITLGHLLTHSAGLACDDNADASPGNEDMMESDRTYPDWTKRTLDLPMSFEPGTHYAYCSMNINLVGAALSEASGEWLPALFDRTVAKPLQFGRYYWNLIPNGEGYLGGGAFVRTRDFLKLGQAYLDGGVWNGHRIVTAEWVRDSISAHAHISPATTGLQGDAFRNSYYDVDDGWAWHMIGVKAPYRTYPAFHANGNGGQLLIIVPELDLAVMFTAGNYQQGLWNRERDDIVGGMIIPALPNGPPRH